jgi:hypothetical protein
MVKDPAARAPRGTRTVAQAFFQAIDEIPEDRRADVMKAALSLIRDQIKEAREKARAAKQKGAGARQPAKKQPAKKAPRRKQAKRAASPMSDELRRDETTQEDAA